MGINISKQTHTQKNDNKTEKKTYSCKVYCVVYSLFKLESLSKMYILQL